MSDKKAKWTPGPWTWGNDGESMPIVTAHSRPGYVAFVRDPGCVEGSEIEANTRLIASAPELAAFVAELASDRDDCISPGWKRKAQELIAKVEGVKP